MRVLLKRLVKMIVGYGAVQWAGPFISLLFTKIITQIASPTDYGSAGLVLAFITGIGAFAAYTVPQAMVAHYNDFDDTDWKRQIATSALLSGAVYGVLVALFLLIFAPVLAPLITRDAGDAYYFRVGAPVVLFMICTMVITQAAQVAMRVRWGMLFSLVTILVTVLSNVLVIVVLRLPTIGLIVNSALSNLAVCLVGLIIARPLFGKPTRSTMGILLHSAVWLLPTAISWWVLNSSDRLFLAQVVDKGSIGHYEIAVKIASLLGVLMAPLYSAMTPLALSLQRDPLVKERYVAMARYLVGLALLASLGMGLFATEILLVLTRAEYLPAAPYVGVMAYVHVATALGAMLTVNQMANKRLMQLGVITIAGAVINLLLNSLLIPPFGVWGAAIATVIGMAVPVGLSYWESRRRRALPYPMRMFMVAILIHVGVLWLGLQVPAVNFPIRVGIKLLLLGAYAVSMAWVGMLTRTELRQGYSVMQSQLRRVFAR